MPVSHNVNGKKTVIDDRVIYCDSALVKHDATIKALNPSGRNFATLKVLDGANSTPDLEDVPYSASPSPHTWSHVPE